MSVGRLVGRSVDLLQFAFFFICIFGLPFSSTQVFFPFFSFTARMFFGNKSTADCSCGVYHGSGVHDNDQDGDDFRNCGGGDVVVVV